VAIEDIANRTANARLIDDQLDLWSVERRAGQHRADVANHGRVAHTEREAHQVPNVIEVSWTVRRITDLRIPFDNAQRSRIGGLTKVNTNKEIARWSPVNLLLRSIALHELTEQFADELEVGCDRALAGDGVLLVAEVSSELRMRLQPRALSYKLSKQSLALRGLQSLQIDCWGLLLGKDGRADSGRQMIVPVAI
jgi:hypothetical protein